MNNPFEIRAAGKSGTVEILIYGDIGENFWEPEKSNTAMDLIDEIAELKGRNITVRINSYGGSLVDGVAIYNALQRHDGVVDVAIDAIAYSAASLIAMAGKTITMAENALLMIHAPIMTWVTGNAKRFRIVADILDKHADAMLSSYLRDGGPDEKTVEGWLKDDKDHYFTAAEALEQGLIDVITEEMNIAASLPPSSRFTIPEALMPKTDPNTPDLKLVKQAEVEVLARIKARNDELAPVFAMHADKPGMSELKDQILADPTIAVDKARAMMLDQLGQDTAPLNQVESHVSAGWGQNLHQKDFKEAAVDAMLLRAGITINDPHPGAQDLRGRSILNIAETMIGHRGSTLLGGAGPNEIVRAAMTTSDFPELLSGVAGKSLMIGYESEPATHRQWTREVEFQDFKPEKRVALSETPELLEVPEHGSYEDGSLSERAEAYKPDTYGRILRLTRQSLINDDLGGFTRIPVAFGQSAARLEADKVYARLIENQNMSDGNALFSAAHNNLAATGGALSVATLSEARMSMRTQKGPNGGYLNAVPRFLIVPAAMESEALVLLANEHLERVVNNDTVRSGISWVKSLELVVEPRLDDHSSAGWYLAASHTQVDTVEVCHLAGQRGVFTEEDTEFTTDMYRIKARLDYGCQVIDWVGLYQNPGA
ncbi:MAG: head maturation protease, ClpP-related [Candidatus Thiodiazotropha endolucinida]